MATPANSSASSSSRNPFSALLGSMRMGKRCKKQPQLSIVTDQPTMHPFLSGSSVTGHVRCLVAKSLGITHLAIYLHGYVDVRGRSSNELPDVQPNLAVDMSSRAGRQQAKGGIVPLFERDLVLCKEGLLQPFNYLFQFRLQFPEEKTQRLPSSLIFERGSITYQLNARLTLPDNTVSSAICRLNFLQRVDVGVLPVAEPLALYVEPWSKRKKKRSLPTPATTSEVMAETNSELPPESGLESFQTGQLDGSVRQVEVSYDDASTVAHLARVSHALPHRRTRSDRRSGMSMSRVSSLSAASIATRSTRSLDPSPWSQSLSGAALLDESTITGEFELRKGGWLPGETIPIHCSIQHVKSLKSARGLLVTLYREGRIDTSRTTCCAGSSTVSEDSWTALSNLSVSSNGSVSRFKKELCQTFTPIYFDRISKSARVVPKIKVPEEAFPTVENLPADVLSFVYFAEILLDLGGRMSSKLQGAAQRFGRGRSSSANALSSERCETFWMDNFWDTEHLRRIKGTVSIVLPIIVGSMDSSKRIRHHPEGRSTFIRSPPSYQVETPGSRSSCDFTLSRGSWEEVQGRPSEDLGGSWDWRHVSQAHETPRNCPTSPSKVVSVDNSSGGPTGEACSVPSWPPETTQADPPARRQFPPEESADEKRALRSASNALLPSHPDQFVAGLPAQASSSFGHLVFPCSHDPDEASPCAPNYSSAPDLGFDAPSASSDGELNAKYVLQRCHLMAEASSSDDTDGTSFPMHNSSPSATALLPSAPMLDPSQLEADSEDWIANPRLLEPLPKYER